MNELMDAWSNFINPIFPNGWLVFAHCVALIILSFAATIKTLKIDHYHMDSECIIMAFGVALVFCMCAVFAFALAPVAAPVILAVLLIALLAWGIVRVI